MDNDNVTRTDGSLSFGGLTAMIIGSTIGAGIFTTAGDMASNGAHTASVLIGWGIAGIGMDVALALFQGADQNLFLRIALIPVDVQLALGQRADQLAVLVAVVVVLMRNRLGTLLGIRAREDTLRIGLRLNAPLQRAENQGRHEDRQNQKHKKPDNTSLMLPDHSVQIRFIHNQILPFPRFKKKNRCEIRNSNLKSNNSNTVIPNIQGITPVKP